MAATPERGPGQPPEPPTPGTRGSGPAAPGADPPVARGPVVTPPLGRVEEPAPGTPAAWLPDPSGAPDTIRYWDGLAWTSHVAVRSADS